MKRQDKTIDTGALLPTATVARLEKVEAATSWAKFLLERYRQEQSLLAPKESEIIEVPTNHDKLNE